MDASTQQNAALVEQATAAEVWKSKATFWLKLSVHLNCRSLDFI
jgi:hypothetical protein